MANGNKSNIISIPLNGDLNFAKNKTKISQFNGFNDLNSPIYGGMISPLYMKQRKKASAGNDRPYLDEYGMLRDKEGREILDVSKYKGLKRKELNVPSSALAVYDENTYVSIERSGETYYTALVSGDAALGTKKVVPLSDIKANAAAYTESGLIILNEKGMIHVYDAETFTELASAKSLNSETAELITFYDPLTEWQIISVYQPFGDWDYRKVSSYSETSEVWKAWDEECKDKKREIDRLITESEGAKKDYDDLKSKNDNFEANVRGENITRDYWVGKKNEADDHVKVNGWTAILHPWDAFSNINYWNDRRNEAIGEIRECDDRINKIRKEQKEWLAADNEKWGVTNEEAIKVTWNEYEHKLEPINVAESQLESIKKREPEKFLDPIGTTAANPNIHTGTVDEAYTFIFNTKDNSLTRKTITIPWDKLTNGSQGPDSYSYIITGIYDSYFDKDSSGRWLSNTGFDYVRYRLGVIPHDIEIGSGPTDGPKYFFTLNYTPKIYFRQDSPTTEWKISEDIPKETKTYITNMYEKEVAQDADVYFSGSGAGNRCAVWGKVNFVVEDSEAVKTARDNLTAAQKDESRTLQEKLVAQGLFDEAQKKWEEDPSKENTEARDKAQAELIKKEEAYTAAVNITAKNQKILDDLLKEIPNFNKKNLFHDLGYAKYTMYSPWSSGPNRGNATTESVSGARDITKTYFNYEVSGDGLLWKKPTVGGEYIEKTDAKNIFREVVNNGIISNISIAEDIKHIGTSIETPNSIDTKVPVFYKYGKNGGAVVYKTNNEKWISVEVLDKVEEIKIINDEYLVLYTTKVSNCIRLRDNEIKHFAPDWNNRFSLVGSPYEDEITPLAFPAINNVEAGVRASDMFIASGINVNYEISQDPIVGYTSATMHIFSNEDNITPVGFVSNFDNIDFYYVDFLKDRKSIPSYYTSLSAPTTSYGLFNNIDLAGANYPDYILNTVGLFCKIKPSNFGRFYLEDEDTFYSLNMYNGQLYFVYDTTSLLDDIRDLFMVQGQTFAITKSNYLYSVFVDQRGRSTLADAIANVKGLQFCGAIPEMAIFYSPVDRTLKSFTADHMIRNMEEATLISEVYYTTYSPQTSSVYICTNNGVYVYASTNKYRLPVFTVKEIYFGGEGSKHIYIENTASEPDNPQTIINYVDDYVYDKGYSASQATADVNLEGYETQPVLLETKYYGQGSNLVSVTDCVYFRLYSDEAPFNTELKIKEFSLTDGTYNTLEKTIKINKSDWDERTKTCYVRYQPKNQRSVGLSIQAITECAISEINFSNGMADTAAISKPRMNG